MEDTYISFKPIMPETMAHTQVLQNYFSANGQPEEDSFLSGYIDRDKELKNTILPTQSIPEGIDIARILGTDQIITPEISTPVKSTVSTNNKPVSANAKEGIAHLITKGYTKEQASGIIGNLQAESALNTKAVGDSGLAKGIGQWHPDRQANFKRVFGKDLSNANFKEQLDFVDWELHNTESKALKHLLTTKTPKDAARSFANNYERMKKYGIDRENNAEKFYNS